MGEGRTARTVKQWKTERKRKSEQKGQITELILKKTSEKTNEDCYFWQLMYAASMYFSNY